MTRRILWAALALVPAALAQTIQYEWPPLAGTAQDKETRTLSEMEASARGVLAAYADKRLAAYGVLDVTKAPYNVRGDGKTDNTTALQQAVKDARDARLVAYLPAGTYLVRDTIQCVQGTLGRSGSYFGERLGHRDFPCILQGAPGAKRAVIRLAPGLAAFSNAEKPLPVILVWTHGKENPSGVQPNISMNQKVLSLDIDLGGNPGAIGVDMQGAQGTSIEDVKVNATGAFAGVRGLPGSGGSVLGITVTGGRFGIYAVGVGPYRRTSGSQPSPLVVAARLSSQTEAAILWGGRGPLTLAGALIRGRGIASVPQRQACDGGLNLIDSTIEIDGGGVGIDALHPVYLANTYVRGAATVVRFPKVPGLTAKPNVWTHFREYAGAPEGPFPVWIDGKRHGGAWVDAELAEPPAGLLKKHLPAPPPAGWTIANAANVREAPYGAKGDGKADDTDALDRAIAANPVVYVPKGFYRITRPLRLKAHTFLVGTGTNYSTFVPDFAEPAGKAMIETEDNAAATTYLACVYLRTGAPELTQLRWRAGRDSQVRDVTYYPGASVAIEGHGGGRWYNFEIEGYPRKEPDFRSVRVTGTSEPLVFYVYNPEHTRSTYISEFRDASNVTIFGLKGETFQIGNPATGTRPLLVATRVHNFRIYGAGGLMGAAKGSAPYIFRFDDSSDFLLANVGQQPFAQFDDETLWSALVDNGAGVAVPGTERITLYRKGLGR